MRKTTSVRTVRSGRGVTAGPSTPGTSPPGPPMLAGPMLRHLKSLKSACGHRPASARNTLPRRRLHSRRPLSLANPVATDAGRVSMVCSATGAAVCGAVAARVPAAPGRPIARGPCHGHECGPLLPRLRGHPPLLLEGRRLPLPSAVAQGFGPAAGGRPRSSRPRRRGAVSGAQ